MATANTCQHCGATTSRLLSWKDQRVCFNCRSELEWQAKNAARTPRPAGPAAPPIVPTSRPIGLPIAGTLEACSNCCATIGKLETPMVWNDHVVCAACYERLRAAVPVSPVTRATSTMPNSPATTADHQRRLKGWGKAATILLIFLAIAAVGVFVALKYKPAPKMVDTAKSTARPPTPIPGEAQKSQPAPTAPSKADIEKMQREDSRNRLAALLQLPIKVRILNPVPKVDDWGPIPRITADYTPIPFNAHFEKSCLPAIMEMF